MNIIVTNLESSVVLINNRTINTAGEQPFQSLFGGSKANRPFNPVVDISEATDTELLSQIVFKIDHNNDKYVSL